MANALFEESERDVELKIRQDGIKKRLPRRKKYKNQKVSSKTKEEEWRQVGRKDVEINIVQVGPFWKISYVTSSSVVRVYFIFSTLKIIFYVTKNAHFPVV